MPMPQFARAVLVAATAVLLIVPSAAVAKDGDRGGGDGRGPGLPTTYLLDPVGPAADRIFPEGIAARGKTFYVGSTTDGTIYRGELDEPVATPFLPGGQDGRTQAVGMKIDGHTLFIAGGSLGRVFAYDLRTRELTGSWTVPQPPSEGGPATFLNDLIVTRTGDVYVTDSRRPSLWHIDAEDRENDGDGTLSEFMSFQGTVVPYLDPPAFNLGGIAASQDGRTLVLAHSALRTLFRVDLEKRTVTTIDLRGEPVGADGLVLRGRTLFAIERQGEQGFVVEIRMKLRLHEGRIVDRTSDPTFNDPTTAALVGPWLLVVNSQFGERNTNSPTVPFTVSRVRAR
jgi:sugar lactone lactonase YvrE